MLFTAGGPSKPKSRVAVLATTWIVFNTIVTDWKRALSGLGLMAIGVPLYLLLRDRHGSQMP